MDFSFTFLSFKTSYLRMLWSFSLKVVDLVTVFLRKFWICVGGKQRNKYMEAYIWLCRVSFFQSFLSNNKGDENKCYFTYFKNTLFERPKRNSLSILYTATATAITKKNKKKPKAYSFVKISRPHARWLVKTTSSYFRRDKTQLL